MSSEKTDMAEIHDKSQKPTGLFQSTRVQYWVYLGVTAAVLVPILFSGSKPRAPITPSAVSPPQPTPPQLIQQYEKDLGRERALLDEQKKQFEAREIQPPTSTSGTSPVTIYRTLPAPASLERPVTTRDRTLLASNVVEWRTTPIERVTSERHDERIALEPEAPAPEAPVAPLQKAKPPLYEERNRADGPKQVLFEGSVLEAVLENRLDGYFSGPVKCLLTTDVYSRDREHLLIPKGTEVLGEAQKVNNFDQQRLAVFFHRLIMPDGYSISLDQFKGLDQIGETGLQDLVNHHYLQIFGVSLAIGAVSGLAQANSRYGLDASGLDIYRQGVSTSLSQSATHILDRFLNVLPTVTIREGQRIKIYLAGDLLLPDYDHHSMPEDL